MIKVDGKGGISATVVADSISETGKRITTFELEYPRFIHSEFMTHRLFSRNAASSRAIPVNKMIEHVRENTAMPIHWGKNQKGMQAKEECNNPIENMGDNSFSREEWWRLARDEAVDCAAWYDEAGYHKQIVNRILEPYQFIKVVCSATEFDNFFWLRKHPDAQPEIAELARVMWEVREQSEPMLLKAGEWHVPYYKGNYGDGVWKPSGYAKQSEDLSLQETDHKKFGNTLEDALKISASCCAQVSYRLADNSLEKAKKIYDMLVKSKPVHSSPFEHQCSPMNYPEFCDLENGWEDGVTHMDKQGQHWSGNFCGWVQHRQLIPENACWDFKS